MDKQILILAGPNGAGKTTFAREYLVREGACPSFVNADLAIQRVAQRVRQGGHAVPDVDVRRRFERGRDLFETVYKPLVDAWALYDNAGDTPVLIDSGGKL